MTPRMEPITDASAWTGDDLQRDASWTFSVTEKHKADLDQAIRQVKDRGMQFAEITSEDFPLPSMKETLQDLLDELRTGRGFAVLSDVPTSYDYEDLERLYWGLCAHLGTGVTQNKEAGLIHYITDGELRPQKGARLLGKPTPVKLHVDLADCVGLFCIIRQAPDDPQSLASSSMTVYNEILKHHPEYLTRLYEGFPWKRIDSPFDETPYSDFNVPAYSEADGVVTCRFHPGWIRGGLKAAGKELTDDETEIFDFIAQTAVANSFAFPCVRVISPSSTTTPFSTVAMATRRSKRSRTSVSSCGSG